MLFVRNSISFSFLNCAEYISQLNMRYLTVFFPSHHIHIMMPRKRDIFNFSFLQCFVKIVLKRYHSKTWNIFDPTRYSLIMRDHKGKSYSAHHWNISKISDFYTYASLSVICGRSGFFFLFLFFLHADTI